MLKERIERLTLKYPWLGFIKHNLVKHSGLVLAAMLISSVFSFLFRVILARSLSVAEYGLFFSVLSIMTLLAGLTNFGLAEAYLTRFCKFHAEKDWARLKGLFYFVGASRALIGLVFLSLCWLCSDFLTTYYFRDADAKLLFIILTGSTVLTGITFNFVHVTYRSLQNMRVWGVMRIVDSVMIVLLVSLGFLFWKSPLVAALVYLVGPFLVGTVFYFLLKKELSQFSEVKAKIDMQEIKGLFSFGSSIVLIGLCGYISNAADTMTLTYFSTFESVGLYNAALAPAKAFLLFSTAINIPLLPYISKLYATGDHVKLKRVFKMIHLLCFVCLLPIALLGALLAKYVIWLSFGKEYISASPALAILCVSMFLMLIFNINLQFLMATGKVKIGNIILFMGAAIDIALNLLLVFRWDFVGVALSTCLGYLIMAAAGFVYNWKKL